MGSAPNDAERFSVKAQKAHLREPHTGFQRLVGDLDKNDTEATLWVLRNEPLLTP